MMTPCSLQVSGQSITRCFGFTNIRVLKSVVLLRGISACYVVRLAKNGALALPRVICMWSRSLLVLTSSLVLGNALIGALSRTAVLVVCVVLLSIVTSCV